MAAEGSMPKRKVLGYKRVVEPEIMDLIEHLIKTVDKLASKRVT